MFTAPTIPPIAYVDPWNVSVDDRLSALETGCRRIVYLYGKPDASTFRYRVFNMVEAIAATKSRELTASWFSLEELNQANKFIDRSDVLVLCRIKYNAAVNRLIARAAARGVRVLFDIDDMVFDPDFVHLVVERLEHRLDSEDVWDYWFADFARYGATLRLCDGAIATNQFLAERITAVAPWVRAAVVPNFLNWRQQRLSQKIFTAKRDSRFARDDKIHIGYFSGTATHKRDFELVTDVLTSVLADDARVVLRLVGFIEPTGRLQKYRDRFEIYPYQDFINLQRLIGEVEINIVPLRNNEFANCKSELKYFEAAVVGTNTVASPTFAFRNAIEDGKTGHLAAAHQWGTKIQYILESLETREDYISMAERAFEVCNDSYGWDRQAPLIEKATFSG